MTQKEIAADLLLRHKRVTLRMAFENNIGYTFRNRISELKKEGWIIHHETGSIPSENAYILISQPLNYQFDNIGQADFLMPSDVIKSQ